MKRTQYKTKKDLPSTTFTDSFKLLHSSELKNKTLVNHSKFKSKSGAGFVLLFALLVSSILLATGLGISRIILREIFLASLSRESQVAFFAADTGAECALHWRQDFRFDLDSTNPSRAIFCNGQAIRDGTDGMLKISNGIGGALQFKPNLINGSDPSIFSFYTQDLPVSGEKVPCALVRVSFNYRAADVSHTQPPIETVIHSDGYNSCDLTSPRTIERSLEYTIENCDPTDPTCR